MLNPTEQADAPQLINQHCQPVPLKRANTKNSKLPTRQHKGPSGMVQASREQLTRDQRQAAWAEQDRGPPSTSLVQSGISSPTAAMGLANPCLRTNHASTARPITGLHHLTAHADSPQGISHNVISTTAPAFQTARVQLLKPKALNLGEGEKPAIPRNGTHSGLARAYSAQGHLCETNISIGTTKALL